MKQSSIEFLEERIKITNKEVYAELFGDIEQARAMHKDEIFNAYWDGGQWVPTVGSKCEEYYNETSGYFYLKLLHSFYL